MADFKIINNCGSMTSYSFSDGKKEIGDLTVNVEGDNVVFSKGDKNIGTIAKSYFEAAGTEIVVISDKLTFDPDKSVFSPKSEAKSWADYQNKKNFGLDKFFGILKCNLDQMGPEIKNVSLSIVGGAKPLNGNGKEQTTKFKISFTQKDGSSAMIEYKIKYTLKKNNGNYTLEIKNTTVSPKLDNLPSDLNGVYELKEPKLATFSFVKETYEDKIAYKLPGKEPVVAKTGNSAVTDGVDYTKKINDLFEKGGALAEHDKKDNIKKWAESRLTAKDNPKDIYEKIVKQFNLKVDSTPAPQTTVAPATKPAPSSAKKITKDDVSKLFNLEPLKSHAQKDNIKKWSEGRLSAGDDPEKVYNTIVDKFGLKVEAEPTPEISFDQKPSGNTLVDDIKTLMTFGDNSYKQFVSSCNDLPMKELQTVLQTIKPKIKQLGDTAKKANGKEGKTLKAEYKELNSLFEKAVKLYKKRSEI